jgi:hypothetical protein
MLTVGHGGGVAAGHEVLCPLRAPWGTTVSGEAPWYGGELAARISTTVVGALARTTGRGPTKARTTLGGNGIFVVLQDSLTRGEPPTPTPARALRCWICVGAGSVSCKLTSAARSRS